MCRITVACILYYCIGGVGAKIHHEHWKGVASIASRYFIPI